MIHAGKKGISFWNKKKAFMKQKTIEIPGVGDVLLEQSPRARHMNLSMRPFRGVRVAVPPGVSFGAAESFARSKSDWMMARLPRLKAAEAEAARQAKAGSAALGNLETARSRLKARLEMLSQKLGLPYGRAAVRNQRTRWGSCSAKKNINLNINLAYLPEKLMDYAMIHELVHTRVMNHGRTFWALMESLIPGARVLDGELRRHSPLSLMQEPDNQALTRSEIHYKGE